MQLRRLSRCGLLAVVLASAISLPGCQAWNAWLDFWRWKGGDNQPRQPLMPGESAGRNGLQMLPTRMIVYRIKLPVGTFSTNDKIWSQLNEDVLNSKTAVLFAQNGLRAGIAPIGRWNNISKLLDVPGAATDQMVCETDGHSTVNVVTRAGVADQIVVSVDSDLEQQGRTFSRCDDGFRMSMRKTRVLNNAGNARPQLVVQLEPIVMAAAGNRPGRLGDAGVAFTSEEAFADLDMATTLNPDQFLVVAPQDPKGSRFSVGSLWLSDIDKVPPTETVLVFVPVLGGTVQSAGK